MYKIKEIKKDINCISVYKKTFCYNTKKEDLFFNNEIINTKTSVCGYFFSKNYFTYSNNIDFTNTIIDLILNKTTHLGKISLQFQIDDKNFVGLEKIDGKKNLVIYNLDAEQSKTISKDISFGLKLVYKGSLIINQGWTTLKSLSLLTGLYEWATDLTALHLGGSIKLKKVLGVWHDELLLWVNDAMLVSLDVATGALLWSYDLDDSVKGFGAVLMSPFYDAADGENTIFCFGPSGYLTFDLITRAATFHHSFGRIGTGMNPHQSTKVGDYFYFVGRDYSIENGLVVGVFSIKTLNIEWLYTNPEWETNVSTAFSSAPQVTDNELYVLENGTGTLHIFEKVGI